MEVQMISQYKRLVNHAVILMLIVNHSMLTVSAQAAPACVSLPPGLISRWTGELTAADFVGVNNGALVNGANYAAGMVGNAFNFDDRNYAHISVPDSPSLHVGTGDFSMDAWIKTSSIKDLGSIQHKNIPGLGYEFFVRIGGFGPGVQFGDGKNTVTIGLDGGIFLADGYFHHVAVSVQRHEPDGIRLFLDGNLVRTGDPRAVTGSLDNNAPFLIGGHNIDAWRSFSGLIDEFEFYKRALTDDEVRAIYLAGSAGVCCDGVVPKLSALISGKTGSQIARAWNLSLTNKSSCASAAENAQIDGLVLSQTAGATCTPVITSPLSFPLGVGNIQANSQASGTATIDFTGCPSNARFKVIIPFSSNNGAVTGSKTLNNQFR
jgi:Concanavalin A-like lectin/glucanases superfamily